MMIRVVAICCAFTATLASAQVATAPHGAAAAHAPAAQAGIPGMPPPPPPLPHPATEAQVRELLLSSNTPTTIHKDFEQGVDALKAKAPPFVPQSVWVEMRAKLQGIDVVKVELPYYQGYISEQDMTALLAFNHSEAGKHYAAVMDKLIGSTGMALSANAENVVQSTLAQHREEIEAARKKSQGQSGPTAPPK